MPRDIRAGVHGISNARTGAGRDRGHAPRLLQDGPRTLARVPTVSLLIPPPTASREDGTCSCLCDAHAHKTHTNRNTHPSHIPGSRDPRLERTSTEQQVATGGRAHKLMQCPVQHAHWTQCANIGISICPLLRTSTYEDTNQRTYPPAGLSPDPLPLCNAMTTLIMLLFATG